MEAPHAGKGREQFDRESPKLSRRRLLRLSISVAVSTMAIGHVVSTFEPSVTHAAGARMSPYSTDDPLPSWNDTAPRQAILDFVAAVTTEGSNSFVPPAERIATFDNDGTLWYEQPLYVQLASAIDRVSSLAPQHPEWSTTDPFRAVLQNDHAVLAASGLKGLTELVIATHTGMTTVEFDQIVKTWRAQARHPRFDRLYTDLAFKPMVELLGYLRAHGFKTYIVTGGGIEVVRAISEPVYGIPPEQVIGSSGTLKYELRDGGPVLTRLPESCPSCKRASASFEWR